MNPSTILQYAEFGFALVGFVYGILTTIANQSPASKVGMFCARWAGTAKHTIDLKPEVAKQLQVVAELAEAAKKLGK